MTTTASDGFGTWTSGPGAMADCKVFSSNLYGTGINENGCRVLTPTFAADQSATMVMATFTAQLGVMVRMQSSDCSGYLASVDDDTHISIFRVADSGTIGYTLLGATITVSALIAGDAVKLSITGTTLEVFINGASQGTRTDATYATGQPGLYFFSSSGGVASFSAL